MHERRNPTRYTPALILALLCLCCGLQQGNAQVITIDSIPRASRPLFIHAIMYAVPGLGYEPNTAQNVPFKLTPGFTVNENAGFTIAGDSITILYEGDYLVHFVCAFSGATATDWHFSMWKNFSTEGVSAHAYNTSTGAGNYTDVSWFNYYHFMAGDVLCWKVTNITNNFDPLIHAIKWYIEKAY